MKMIIKFIFICRFVIGYIIMENSERIVEEVNLEFKKSDKEPNGTIFRLLEGSLLIGNQSYDYANLTSEKIKEIKDSALGLTDAQSKMQAANGISNLTKTYSAAVSEGRVEPIEAMFSLIGAKLTMNSNEIPIVPATSISDHEPMMKGDMREDVKALMNQVKDEVEMVGESFVNYEIKKFGKFEKNMKISTNFYSVQLFSSEYLGNNIVFEEKERWPIVDPTECISEIQKYYNFTENTNIPIQKINWDELMSSLPYGLKAVTFRYFHPFNGSMIDSASICKNVKVKVMIPLMFDYIRFFNMTLFNLFKAHSINIYDKTHDFYHSRCVSYSDDKVDYSLSKRRSQLFPNISILCSDGCDFEGFDNNHYTICNCNPLNETKAEVNVSGFVETISASNINIIVCVDKAFDPNILNSNLGFWCNGSFFILTLVFICVFKSYESKNFSKNVKSYIQQDANIFGGVKHVSQNNKLVCLKDIRSNMMQLQRIRQENIINVLVLKENQFKLDASLELKDNKSDESKAKLEFNKENEIQQTIENRSKEFTKKDYELMKFEDLMRLDGRKFWRYYFDQLIDNHLVLSAFYKKSLIVPQAIRIVTFFAVVSYFFALNAIFYNDDYIDSRYESFGNGNQNELYFTLANQFWKSVWSILIGTLPIILMKCLLKVPQKIFLEFNSVLIRGNDRDIIHAYGDYLIKMKMRFYLYFFIAFIFHLFSWYYVTAFCGVYIQSSSSWMYGGIISLLIKFFIFSTILPLCRTLLRNWAREYFDKKCISNIYRVIVLFT